MQDRRADRSTKPSCDARPDHTFGSISDTNQRDRHGRTCSKTGRQRRQLLACGRTGRRALYHPGGGCSPETGRQCGRPWLRSCPPPLAPRRHNGRASRSNLAFTLDIAQPPLGNKLSRDLVLQSRASEIGHDRLRYGHGGHARKKGVRILGAAPP